MLSPIDTAVICGVALLLFGPKKFPEIGKALGQGLGNFKKALNEAQHEVKEASKIEGNMDAKSETVATADKTPVLEEEKKTNG